MIQSLLGEILRGDRLPESVADIFFDSHGVIVSEQEDAVFHACRYLESAGIEVSPLSVAEVLLSHCELAKVGGITYLFTLIDTPGVAA